MEKENDNQGQLGQNEPFYNWSNSAQSAGLVTFFTAFLAGHPVIIIRTYSFLRI
jgi:hypothetical protein